jgi:malonyl-CoA O-methyltransferase
LKSHIERLEPRAAYELWADSYPAVAHNPLMRAEQEVVGPLLAHTRARRALDVGCGSGRYLPPLASTGAATVVGVDFSMAMLTRGVQAPDRQEQAPRVCADACRLPFRRSAFDLINASLMVGDVTDLGQWCGEMARVLAIGGHLVYSDFHPSWAQNGWSRTFRAADGGLREVPFHSHSIDDHLTALGAAGFRIVAIREPRFKDDHDREVRAFRRRWRNPRVIVVFHASRER